MRISLVAVPVLALLAVTGGCAVYRPPEPAPLTQHAKHRHHAATHKAGGATRQTVAAKPSSLNEQPEQGLAAAPVVTAGTAPTPTVQATTQPAPLTALAAEPAAPEAPDSSLAESTAAITPLAADPAAPPAKSAESQLAMAAVQPAAALAVPRTPAMEPAGALAAAAASNLPEDELPATRVTLPPKNDLDAGPLPGALALPYLKLDGTPLRAAAPAPGIVAGAGLNGSKGEMTSLAPTVAQAASNMLPGVATATSREPATTLQPPLAAAGPQPAPRLETGHNFAPTLESVANLAANSKPDDAVPEAVRTPGAEEAAPPTALKSALADTTGSSSPATTQSGIAAVATGGHLDTGRLMEGTSPVNVPDAKQAEGPPAAKLAQSQARSADDLQLPSDGKTALDSGVLSLPAIAKSSEVTADYQSAAQQATAPTIANALLLDARTSLTPAGLPLIAEAAQLSAPPRSSSAEKAAPADETAPAAARSLLPGFAATPARRGFIVALSPLVAAGAQPLGPAAKQVGPIAQPNRIAANGQDATAIFGLPSDPRGYGAPFALVAAVKGETARLTTTPGQQPLNIAPATVAEANSGGVNRAAGGAALKPVGSMGGKVADASAVGPAANAASTKSASALKPCDQDCKQSQPVPIPADEAVGLTPETPAPPNADAVGTPQVTAGTEGSEGWGSSLSRFWSSSLAKLGFGDQPQSASADPAPAPTIEFASNSAAAAEPRLRKTLPQGVALSRVGPEYDGKPLAVAKDVLPVAEGEAAPRVSGDARIEQVSTGPHKDGAAGEPLSPTIAVNTVELTDTQAVQQPDLSFAEARFDAGASPIAPFGATPSGYDIRGFMMDVIPKSNEVGMADCAVSLSQSRNGSFSVTSLAGSAKVALGTDESTASTGEKQPAVKPKRKNQKDAAPVVPVGSRPIQAVIVLSQGNKPFLQVDFPGGGEGGFPPPWSCRYWLEISPPTCKLSVVSHRARIVGSQSILETNSVGKCQLARINTQDVH